LTRRLASPQLLDATRAHERRRSSYEHCEANDAAALARGLIDLGVRAECQLVLLVKPGIAFVKLVFALLRTGTTMVLVDPGMGRKHLVNCLAASQPDGFIAISAAQAARVAYHRRFPKARLNVTVGRRWFWGGANYEKLIETGRRSGATLPDTFADDRAAIIFTSGSTGPPKGVLYTHRMFDTQASEIQRAYDLQPGGVDLACFALFALFNSVMGVTTVLPEMDFSRPASADPKKLLAAANRWQVTQAFASPAVWDKLSRHCIASGERIPSLRKVFSCGAPVPASVLERTLQVVHTQAEMHTPYGATEALPVATIESTEVLGQTAARTVEGAGVCVGRKFDTIDWRVIRITDESILTIDETEELAFGEIGELVVRGPQVSPAYMDAVWTGRLRDQSEAVPTVHTAKRDANALAKIRDGERVWHRMGDVGYLDDQGRFWYCGRKSQRVRTRNGPLFSAPVEEVFNELPGVRKSALVGVGPEDDQEPVVIVETEQSIQSGPPKNADQLGMVDHWHEMEPRLKSLWYAPEGYVPLRAILFHAHLPVDVRHNSKINREQLAEWAARQLEGKPGDDGPRPLAGD
jgi:acyl-CoA synthetase (AMP-forming)/AMP-acid ligase II